MHRSFNKSAEQVMKLAGERARRLNHDYVGTEHILLGLMGESSGMIGSLLSSLGAAPARIEQEIEMLVHRGAHASMAHILPLTPRARYAIDLAHREAATLSQRLVEPEHLLLGLLLEADGVAGRVLRNMGLEMNKVASLVMKDRLAQMNAIERIVRPFAPMVRKRKMREELLAHLEELCEEEYAGGKDRAAALAAAINRFGDPAKLSQEMDRAVWRLDRASFYTERWLGWRAPEPASRMMLRASFVTFAFMAVLLCPLFLASLLLQGWNDQSLRGLRIVTAILFLMPTAQFGLGISYFKMRDALWGVFGSHRSVSKMLLFAGLNGLVVITCGLAFIGLADWRGDVLLYMIPAICCVGLFIAIAYACQARFHGPTEIRDTIWSCLPVEGDARRLAS